MTIDGVERRATPWPEWAVSTRIDTHDYVAQVWEAVRAQRSQLAGYDRLMALSAEEQQAIFGTQTFYRALSFTTGGREQESELFQDEAFQPVSLLEHHNSSAISEAARPAAPGIKAR